MLQAFVITLREGLEAFLIVAISLAYLRKSGRHQLIPAVHWGIGLSVLLSIGAGVLFQRASNQALWEGMVYDESGQPLSGSLMDYVMPKSIDLPDFDLDSSLETLSPITALGVKGIGELPTLAAPVAIANAVMDALSSAGVKHIDTPLTPQKVWQALQDAGQA